MLKQKGLISQNNLKIKALPYYLQSKRKKNEQKLFSFKNKVKIIQFILTKL